MTIERRQGLRAAFLDGSGEGRSGSSSRLPAAHRIRDEPRSRVGNRRGRSQGIIDRGPLPAERRNALEGARQRVATCRSGALAAKDLSRAVASRSRGATALAMAEDSLSMR